MTCDGCLRNTCKCMVVIDSSVFSVSVISLVNLWCMDVCVSVGIFRGAYKHLCAS